MSDIKKFFELLAKDNAVKAELERASFAALNKLIEDNGLKSEAEKALREAREKVAEAYGLNLRMDELDEDELKAVSGGIGCSDALFEQYQKDLQKEYCSVFGNR